MALPYPATKQPKLSFSDILKAAQKLTQVGSQAAQMTGFNGQGLGAASAGLGFAGNIAESNPIGAAQNATQLASQFSPEIAQAAGPIGLGLGGIQAGMNGSLPQWGVSTLTNPGTIASLGNLAGLEATGTAGLSSLGSGAALAPAAGASIAAAPIALGALGAGISGMISANNAQIAAARNMSRTKQAGGIMQARAQAVQGGNLDAEVSPGVRAGDLLQGLASASASGDLVAGGDIYGEGVYPKGQYQSLADLLSQRGYKGSMNAINTSGKGNVNNLAELVGALDDSGPRTNQSGDAYGRLGTWLDQLSGGLGSPLSSQDAFVRSALWRDTPTGGAALLGARRNELAGLGQATDPATVLGSYLNDPEKISVTPLSLRPQLAQAAQSLGLAVPNFDQMMFERDQRLAGQPVANGA